MHKKRMMRSIIQILVDALLIFTVIALVPFAWILRDGLGPDATTSSGIQAVWRCLLTFYSGPILAGLTVLAIACHRTGKKKRTETTEQHVCPVD